MSTERVTLYKYLSATKALRLLRDGELYFAGVHQLNDILEAKFDHASSEDFMAVSDATYRQVFKSRGEQYDATITHDVPPDFVGINDTENERFSKFVQGVGIFSTALRPNHQAMWAYYADNSKGVCLEFEFSDDVMNDFQLFPVMAKYTLTGRIHNRAEDWREAFLGLAEEYPDDTVDQLHERSLGEEFRRSYSVRSVGRAASVKHTDWEHEQELRIIAAKYGPRKILKATLRAAHFASANFAGFSEIKEILHTEYGISDLYLWRFETGAEDGVRYRMTWPDEDKA